MYRLAIKEIVKTEQRAVIPTNIFKKSKNKVMSFEKIPTRVISPNLSFLGETV